MIFPFKRLQSRITFFFLGLVALVQSIVFITVDRTNTHQARAHIEQALVLGAGNFQRMMAQRTSQLIGSVRILSSDFAFKSALVTGDKATVHSVLANHGRARRRGRDDSGFTGSNFLDDPVEQRRYPRRFGSLLREAEAREWAAGLVVWMASLPAGLLPVLGPESDRLAGGRFRARQAPGAFSLQQR